MNFQLGWQPPGDDWEPGIPLYDRARHGNSQYLFNFRADSETEECHCFDRAEWPTLTRHVLPDGDELGRFIDECHESQQESA